jgi:uncharacterized SAM-binding protein YcdF (DUF218 family)
MGYILSKVLGALLTPGMLFMLALSAGTALLWSPRHWRGGRRLVTALAVVFFGLVLSPLQPMLTEILEDRFPANPPLPAHVDGIIVLGAAIDQYVSQARHRISLSDAAERVTSAVQLARAHPEARVLLTGGSADPMRPDLPEAPMAAQLLQSLGVAPDRLVIEDQSRNTYENAVFGQRLVDPKAGQSWVVITSARHMPRAVGVFRRLGWPVIPYPVDFTSGVGLEWANVDVPLLRVRLLAQAIHEWIGLVYYRLSGWTKALFPGP